MTDIDSEIKAVSIKVFLSIKYHEDQRNRFFIEELTREFKKNRMRLYCIVRDCENWGLVHYPAQDLMAETFSQIRCSNYLLVDIREKGVGIGVEAGYAAALQIPIIAAAPIDQMNEVSTTLMGIAKSVIYYKDCADLVDQFMDLI